MRGKRTPLAAFAVLLSVVASSMSQPVDPNLVGWWSFNEGSGTTAFDASGKGNDGMFNGNLEWVEGYKGGYAVHVVAEGQSVLHSFAAPKPWPAGTVAVWVKADTVGQPASSGVFSSYTPNTAGFQIDTNGGDPGEYRFQPGGTLFGPVAADWVHLAVTWDATSARLYYNGNPAATFFHRSHLEKHVLEKQECPVIHAGQASAEAAIDVSCAAICRANRADASSCTRMRASSSAVETASCERLRRSFSA